jgi:hypothetical protein
MDRYSQMISILIQHSQRFLDFWNYQIVISLAALGFIFSNPGMMSRRSVRLFISATFLMMAVFTVYFLYVNERREEKMFAAIQSHVAASPADFTKADIDYIESLKPTPFAGKAGVLVFADFIIIAAVWVSPKMLE